MRRIALAGGIGAGKSTVSEFISSRGYVVVDADDVARHVVTPGENAYRALIDAFGSAVLTPSREIDRAFLADVVFHDASALRRLNAITHGPIGRELVGQLDAASGEAIFVALPLFRAEHRRLLEIDEVWAVLSDPAIALERLTGRRHMDLDDANSRIRAQITNAEREELADVTIWNNGSLTDLFTRIEELLDQRGLA